MRKIVKLISGILALRLAMAVVMVQPASLGYAQDGKSSAVNRWTGEITLADDCPGLGKKGDKISVIMPLPASLSGAQGGKSSAVTRCTAEITLTDDCPGSRQEGRQNNRGNGAARLVELCSGRQVLRSQ